MQFFLERPVEADESETVLLETDDQAGNEKAVSVPELKAGLEKLEREYQEKIRITEEEAATEAENLSHSIIKLDNIAQHEIKLKSELEKLEQEYEEKIRITEAEADMEAENLSRSQIKFDNISERRLELKAEQEKLEREYKEKLKIEEAREKKRMEEEEEL